MKRGKHLGEVFRLALLGVSVAFTLIFVAFTALTMLPSKQGDVLTGRDGVLYPAWVRMIGERPADDAAVADQVVAAHARLVARDVSLIVVIVPAKARAAGSAAPGALRRRAQGLAYSSWISSIRLRGVETVDALEAAGAQGFLKSDTHWTAPAAERAADLVAQVVTRHALLGDIGDGQAPGAWTRKTRRGDLAELVARRGQGALAAEIVLERSFVPPTPAQTAIWVVGSSFAAPDHGFPQRLSAQADRATRSIVHFGEAGAWAALKELEGLRLEPGQVVVWILTEGGLTEAHATDR